jgi:hypothetical protein
MQVSLKQIFESFLQNYVKVHFQIKQNHFGFSSSLNNHEKYTISKHSLSITHWYEDIHGKTFEEFKIVKDKGNIEIKKENKTLMKFSCKTEPLVIKN